MLLDGKRVVITGGSRGLGRALGERFAAEGARVAFTYSRDEATAAAALAAMQQSGGRGADARRYRVSVLDGPATVAMFAELERDWGGVDVLVNNAGANSNLPLALLEEADFDEVVDVNLKGTFLTAKAALRGMIRRKSGVVLNVGSLAGSRMIDAPVHYCASKAAVVGLTQSLAKEVGRHGVRVLCLAPGLLEDGMGGDLPQHRIDDYVAHVPLGRLGRLEEVARVAAFLVSDQNSYMNGETVVVDGGL